MSGGDKFRDLPILFIYYFISFITHKVEPHTMNANNKKSDSHTHNEPENKKIQKYRHKDNYL